MFFPRFSESEQATPETMRFDALLENIASGPRPPPRVEENQVGQVTDAQLESEYNDLNPELFSSRVARARMVLQKSSHAHGGRTAGRTCDRASPTDANKKRSSAPPLDTNSDGPVDKRHRT